MVDAAAVVDVFCEVDGGELAGGEPEGPVGPLCWSMPMS